VKLAKVAKKSSTFDVTHKKNAPPTKKFFQVQSTTLAASFDTSTRSIKLTGAEIFPCKATCHPGVFCETLELTWRQSVKHLYKKGYKILKLKFTYFILIPKLFHTK